MDSNMLGRRLRAARGARSRKWVSQSAGFNQTTYGRWEDGERAIGALDLLKVCRVLGVSIEEILYEDDPSWADDAWDTSLRRLQAAVEALQEKRGNAAPNMADLFAQQVEGWLPILDAARESAPSSVSVPMFPAAAIRGKRARLRVVKPSSIPVVTGVAAETEDAWVIPSEEYSGERYEMEDAVLVEVFGESAGDTAWPGQFILIDSKPVPLSEIVSRELVVILTDDGNYLKRKKGKGWVDAGVDKPWKRKLENPRYFRAKGVIFE